MYLRLFAACVVLFVAISTLPATSADQPAPRVFTTAPAVPVGGVFWFDAAYLNWTAKGDRLPALVTQGGTGVLGAPGTAVIFGNSDVNDGWRSGARVRLGYWFEPTKRTGLDAHFFGLSSKSTRFNAASDGSVVLGQPFINAAPPPINVAILVAFPGLLSGQISISDTSRLVGAGGSYRTELCSSCAFGSVHGLIGYRYLNLRDKLAISTSSVGLGAFAGNIFLVAEQFATTNQFHGLDFGLNGQVIRGPWSMEWTAKLALGATLSDVAISGSNSITAGGATVVTPGGLFAQPTNIGAFDRSTFSVVTELSANVGYQISPSVKAFVGYDFLYWSRVIRPGGTIDTTLNITQLNGGALVGPARPQAQFNSSDYWAHGVNVGVKASF